MYTNVRASARPADDQAITSDPSHYQHRSGPTNLRRGRTSPRGEPNSARRARRSGIAATHRAFAANLLRLKRYRARRADSITNKILADGRDETEIADRPQRHQSGTAYTEAQPDADEPVDPQSSDRQREASAAPVPRIPCLNRQLRRALKGQSRKGIDPGKLQISNAHTGRQIQP